MHGSAAGVTEFDPSARVLQHAAAVTQATELVQQSAGAGNDEREQRSDTSYSTDSVSIVHAIMASCGLSTAVRVIVDGIALQPQTQCLPVDGADDLRGHQRIAPQHAGERARFKRPTLQLQASRRIRATAAHHVHVHAQIVARCA